MPSFHYKNEGGGHLGTATARTEAGIKPGRSAYTGQAAADDQAIGNLLIVPKGGKMKIKNPVAKGWDPKQTKSRDNSGEGQRTNKDRRDDPPPSRGNSSEGHKAVRPFRRSKLRLQSRKAHTLYGSAYVQSPTSGFSINTICAPVAALEIIFYISD